MSSGKCAICFGVGSRFNSSCTFCSGTGDWNKAADAFMKNHICLCASTDRKNCPVCEKKCHHNGSNTTKVEECVM